MASYQNPSGVKNGFSMMESILAVFVLSIGIVGVMSLLVSSMRQSMDSRDTIIATELVQEGLELVRNVRDNDVAGGGDGIAAIPTGDNCRISHEDGSVACGLAYALMYSAGGFYNHSSGADTKFQRKIVISGGATQIIVKSIVIWGSDFPSAGESCNVSNKCTEAQSILTAR